MAKWKRKTLKLQDTHGWKARPGCRIFVADKGAVRFDFPMHWIMEPTADCFQFHDRQPPNDDCRLAVSYQRLPAIDWSDAPLADMLRQVIEQDPRGLTPTTERCLHSAPRLAPGVDRRQLHRPTGVPPGLWAYGDWHWR